MPPDAVEAEDDAAPVIAVTTTERFASLPREPARRRARPGHADGTGDGDGAGGGSGAVGTAVVAPRAPVRAAPVPVDTPAPAYPGAARRAEIEGVVRLEADVAADGTVTGVRVLESSGSSMLDDAAEAAVRRWRYEPATEDGVAVAATVRLPPIRFRLQRGR
jgi:protein TonB